MRWIECPAKGKAIVVWVPVPVIQRMRHKQQQQPVTSTGYLISAWYLPKPDCQIEANSKAQRLETCYLQMT